MLEIKGKVNTAICYAKVIEDEAIEQIRRMCNYPMTEGSRIRIMPDVHAGKGCTIGTTMTIIDKAVPNVVGVDIGCGMYTVRLAEREIDLEKLDEAAHFIPSGMNVWEGRQERFDLTELRCYRALKDAKRLERSLGTLGGGNHFIEVDQAADGTKYLVIHSGSRNLGKQVGDYYNEKADMLNRRWFSTVKSEIMLPFIPLLDPLFKEYWNEMEYCIEFGLCNRRLMIQRIEEVIADAIPDAEFEPMINISHNYAAWENHFGENCIVHRKGAIRARPGEIGIIPGSQGTSSYIVEGLGNPDSFMSCSHGAGRAMSRTEAVHTLDLEKEKERLDNLGIVHAIRCQQDLEEAASAYKNIEEVIAKEQDLVKIILLSAKTFLIVQN